MRRDVSSLSAGLLLAMATLVGCDARPLERSLEACYAVAGAALPAPSGGARTDGPSGACLSARAATEAPYVVTIECEETPTEEECVRRLEDDRGGCAAGRFDVGATCDAYPRLEENIFR